MSLFAASLPTAVPPTNTLSIATRAASHATKRAKPKRVPTPAHHTAKTDTVNEAGGDSFTKSSLWALLSLIFTSLLSRSAKKFYESDASVLSRLHDLVKANPYEAAQAAVWARRVLGLRSITHAVAAMVVHYTKGGGADWVRLFVRSVLFRPDDAIEIVSAYFALFAPGVSIYRSDRRKKVPVVLPNPLKKGIADYLSTLNGYQLAKYAGNDKVKLVDLFNLTHPRPAPENQEAVKAFMKGQLKNVDTWEARLSAAGSRPCAKAKVWQELLAERKLGYFATLRNLRNILEVASDDTIAKALEFIQSPNAVAKSLILPNQFVTAFREVGSSGFARAGEAARAIEAAVEASLKSIPILPGRTLIALDTSGSMGNRTSEDSAAGRGSLMAAIALKTQPGADLLTFATKAQYQYIAPTASLFETLDAIRQSWTSGGTNFHTIFTTAKTRYDNIIILSDGEGWMANNQTKWQSEFGAPTSARRVYETKFGVQPHIFMFDLAGAGSMMFPEKSVANLAGFSDKVFTLLAHLRQDPQALLKVVQAVDFKQIVEEDEE